MNKPHIRKGGLGGPHGPWYCVGHGVVGCGFSPHTAYMNWVERVFFIEEMRP